MKRKVDAGRGRRGPRAAAAGRRLRHGAARFYPQRELAAHVLGFAGVDGEGLEGVELAPQTSSSGRAAQIVVTARRARRPLRATRAPAPTEALQGAGVALTIDRGIQHVSRARARRRRSRAPAASGHGGRDRPVHRRDPGARRPCPTFNPNDPALPRRTLRNRAVADSFEPGSTFKAFTRRRRRSRRRWSKPGDLRLRERAASRSAATSSTTTRGTAGSTVGRVIAQVSSTSAPPRSAEARPRAASQRYLAPSASASGPASACPASARADPVSQGARSRLATMSFGQGMTASPRCRSRRGLRRHRERRRT